MTQTSHGIGSPGKTIIQYNSFAHWILDIKVYYSITWRLIQRIFNLLNLIIIMGKSIIEQKELANWIYYEDGNYYCFNCVEKRVNEINVNKEFSNDIDYEGGDKCGHYQDYASEDYEICCCKCSKPLFSNVDDVDQITDTRTKSSFNLFEDHLNQLYSDTYSEQEAIEQFDYMRDGKIWESLIRKHFTNHELGNLLRKYDPICFHTLFNESHYR